LASYTEHKIDKTAFSVVTFEEHELEEREYWKSQTPHERLEALELTRQLLYGYDPATIRFQFVLEIVEQT